MKAFLSHSSSDKELVASVAKELGRQFCIYDAQSFSSGGDFRKSIEMGLDDSCVFTLFASKEALKSTWVDFEVDEAWMRKLAKTIPTALVYLIDSSVTHLDVPTWLARVSIRRENSPKTIARDIRSHIDQLLAARQYSYFMGRHAEITQFESALAPVDGSPPPRAISIAGLPGIGRRSLVRRVMPNLLRLHKPVEIRIADSDTINDIAAVIADLVEPYSTKEGLERIVNQIQSLPQASALARAVTDLRAMVAAQELPILVDTGGILDTDGYFTSPVISLLRSMPPNDDLYIVLITTRRPLGDPNDLPPHIHLSPLANDDSKRLLSKLASKDQLALTAAQLSEIAEFVAGYPPAAYFAIQQASSYGIDALIANKQRLVQFRTGAFLRYLTKLTLSDAEQMLLRFLAFYSPLPLAVLAEVVALPLQAISDHLIRLIDLALITVSAEGYYSIADPITSAATSTFGFPDLPHHQSIANSLDKFLRTTESIQARLQLSRVLFRVSRIAGDKKIAGAAIHLANDLIAVTETLYHARHYSEVVEVSRAALAERPSSSKARDFLVRALIQEERWQEAEDELQQYRSQVPQRDWLFLVGFLARKRHRIRDAIAAYEASIKAGRRGVAISREIAVCYLIEGNVPEAERHLSEALRRQGDNPFLLDMSAQIAIIKGDEATARTLLAQLELASSSFYFHRLSRLELKLGNLLQAEAAAERAIEVDARPPFSARAQLAHCKTLLDKFTEAEALIQILDQRFPHAHQDISIGLRCRLNIRAGNFRQAIELSEKFSDKTRDVHKAIRRDAIAGELKTSALTDIRRSEYQAELSYLESTLGQISADELISSQIDTALS